MVFQRKSSAKRPAKSYKTDEATEKKPRALKRSILKQAAELPAASFSSDEISQKIRERAYRIFEQRGYSHGDDLSDWYQAEKEVLAEISGSKSSLN